jgi:predicted dehydrogenase
MVVHHPQWQRVRALVAEGAIGDLVGVDGVFHYNNPDPANIRNRAETGGGGLYDIGVYPSVVTRFVTGQEPGAISARVEWENGVDVMARVLAEFQGFTLSFSCGMRQAPRQEMTFHGTEGWLRLPAPFNAGRYGAAQIHWRRKDGTEVIESFHEANHYRLMVEAFGRAIRGEEFACPLEFSRGNQAMIDRIFEAAKA